MSTTEQTAIQWAHYTFNPWRGCTKVSDGCKFCYADVQSKRNPKVLGIWGQHGTRVAAAESYWKNPIQWNKEAEAAGERWRVFCASLADVFEADDTMPPASIDTVRRARVRLFATIHATPHLDWLLLTKRPENIVNVLEESLILAEGGNPDDKDWFERHGDSDPETDVGNFLNDWFDEPPKNVWLGTSVENQDQADARIPHLLKCPAAVRFLSCEPLLSPVDLLRYLPMESCCDGIRREIGKPDWVIVGGESGGHARPCNIDWIRSIRDQCNPAGVAMFVKQLGSQPHDLSDGSNISNAGTLMDLKDKKGGEIEEWPEDLRVRELPEVRP